MKRVCLDIPANANDKTYSQDAAAALCPDFSNVVQLFQGSNNAESLRFL